MEVIEAVYIYPDKIGGDGYQYAEDKWHSGDAAYQDDVPRDRHHRTLCANGEGGHSEDARRRISSYLIQGVGLGNLLHGH